MKRDIENLSRKAVNPIEKSERLNHYRWAILLASLACGTAMAQNNPTSSAPVAPGSQTTTNVTKLPDVVVMGQLDEARNNIVSDLGATAYTMEKEQINAQSQGANASFNQVLLRAPGVSQDSFGQLHVRNEHGFVQYRINDVVLPEGITGFGSELDTRFIDKLELITGTLPAEYGFRTAGIVDIHTKSGAFNQGGDFTMYGGSYETLRPSFEYGGREGKLNYFFNASFLHTALGIENPTSSSSPIHDDSDQYKGFGYLSYLLDDTSRISLIMSGSHSDFQIPNTANLDAGTDGNGNLFPLGGFTKNSAELNENQIEQNYYGVLAYQKSLGKLNFQVAGFSRYSSVLFRPDSFGDLFFNGVASHVFRNILANGVQGDSSYELNDHHTLRAGFQVSAQKAVTETTTAVFGLDPTASAVPPPFDIVDNNSKWGWLYGAYLQDEWKITPKWTVNFGGRADVSDAYITESEFEPRVNTIFNLTEKTVLHAGYARYFTPPPLESIQQTTISKFANTSNAALNGQNDPVKSERSHYFDAGVTQTVLPGLQLGVDGYYKIAEHQLDDGQFGSALIFTPFNYRKTTVYGVEFTGTYKKDGWSIFGNFAYSQQKAKDIESAQFNFDPGDLAYIKDHYIFTDHNQTFTGSAGVSYHWMGTLALVDLLYGNGLRAGGDVPNGRKLPAYVTVNVGIEHDFIIPTGKLKARFDVVNLTDEVYQLRDGTGVGVGAPQFGMRRGFFGSLSYAF